MGGAAAAGPGRPPPHYIGEETEAWRGPARGLALPLPGPLLVAHGCFHDTSWRAPGEVGRGNVSGTSCVAEEGVNGQDTLHLSVTPS